MADNNGDPNCKSGIHQIEYYFFQGFGNEKQFRESRVFLDRNIFLGESGQPEYSPYYFDLYGYDSVEYTTIFGKGNNTEYDQHEFFYVITNNTDPSGGKAGLSTEGCWDTQERIFTLGGPTWKYPDGPYTVLVRGADIFGNWSDDQNAANSRTVTVLNNYSHILYVDDDAPSGGNGSLEHPFRSISNAIYWGGYDILIFVAPGTYNASIENFPILINSDGITLKSSDNQNTIITGTGSTPVFDVTGKDFTLSGFKIENGGPMGYGGITIENTHSIKIENCIITNCSGSGIFLHQCQGILNINNCLINNNAENGVFILDAIYPKISNCTITNNNIGISTEDGGICVLMTNLILADCATGIRAWNGSHCKLTYSDVFNCGDPWKDIDSTSSLSEDPSDILSDPLFESGTYYLNPSSPCVDHGTRTSSMAYQHHSNYWIIDPEIYTKTTRIDNQFFSPGIYDAGLVDLGFHYNPIRATPTPYPPVPPTDTPIPTNSPAPVSTPVPGQGAVYLDKVDYYSEMDTAYILVDDPDLNTNTATAESYEVDVTSDTIYPTTIPMTITEISEDSEYFTTSAAGTDLGFTTGASIPYSKVQVTSGDEITVFYDDASPSGQRTVSGNWYSFEEPTETATPTMTPTVTPSSTCTPTSTPTPHPGIFIEDFESGGMNWTVTGLWHLTDKYSVSPTHAMWYADETTETYDTGGANKGSLISPPILLESGYTTLRFQSRESTDGTLNWDTRKIYISNDAGSSWNLLSQSYNNDNAWYLTAIDLSGYVGDVIQIRFEFDTVDAGDNQHSGWLIDDISIDDSPLMTPTPVPIPATSASGGILLLVLMSLLLLFILKLHVKPSAQN